MIKSIKRRIKHILGKDIYIKPQINVNKEFYGTEYGGYNIATDYIDEKSVVYSLGIGEDISFDLAIIDKYNLGVYAFDPTPKSITYVNKNINGEYIDNFHFSPYGVSNYDGNAMFYLPSNSEYVSGTIIENQNKGKEIKVDIRSLNSLMSMFNHKKIDILKMDIEGAEYEVIEDIVKYNIDVRQILVEFHHRFDKIGIKKTKKAIEQLNSIGYKIFCISENGEEYSFIYSK